MGTRQCLPCSWQIGIFRLPLESHNAVEQSGRKVVVQSGGRVKVEMLSGQKGCSVRGESTINTELALDRGDGSGDQSWGRIVRLSRVHVRAEARDSLVLGSA